MPQEKGLSGGISGRQVDPDGLPPEWYNCERPSIFYSTAHACIDRMHARMQGLPMALLLRDGHVMHAGLHHIADESPVGRSWKPIYHLNKEDNLTGTPRQALPKGSWYNPSKRNWRKVQVWHPPGPQTASSNPSGYP